MSRHDLRGLAASIVRALREAGHTAYFAGGCVRDELLGLAPKDFDVATSARPDEIRRLFPRTAHVGAAFGVVLVHDRAGSVEVATFRSDGPYTDRRRPDAVTFADEIADAQRRDFTVNALFLDPLAPPDSPSRVIDHVGGVGDLAARVLRAVGVPDQRLAEDHLRALRAVRLSTRLGLRIDPATAEAIRRHASSLEGVSRERIGDELRLMLTSDAAPEALRQLHDLLLDRPVFHRPLANGSPPLEAPLLTALRGRNRPFAAALAAALADREGPSLLADTPSAAALRLDVVTTTRAALCLSNDERDDTLATLELTAAVLHRFAQRPVAGQKRLAAARCFRASVDLARGVDAATADRAEQRVQELSGMYGGLAPQPLVDGDRLIGAGFRPGPAFKRLLDQVYDAQLEGRITSAEEGLQLASHLAGNNAGGTGV